MLNNLYLTLEIILKGKDVSMGDFVQWIISMGELRMGYCPRRKYVK